MKRISIMLLAALLYSGAASAQGPNNVVQALLGPSGPVQGLFQSLEQRSLQPLVDGVASDKGLVQGDIAAPLNDTLSGLLVDRNGSQTVNNLVQTVTVTTEALGGVLSRGKGLQRLVLGPNALIKVPLTAEAGQGIGAKLLGGLSNGSFAASSGGGLLGASALSGGGQGLSADEIPLNDIDAASRSALASNVKLQGL